MLKSMTLKNFTVFRKQKFSFGSNLNVLIGENGLGKTHILKAAYSALSVSARGEKDSGSSTPTKAFLQKALANKLNGVFKPERLGRLARRQANRVRCEASFEFDDSNLDLCYSLHSASSAEVSVDVLPAAWERRTPVFLPTRELLTIYPGFVSLYESTHNTFEEIWRDTCLLLGSPLAKGPREKRIKELLEPIEKAMGGKVNLDNNGGFYLSTDGGTIEMHLVAEGLRKLATIARLIATGALLDKGYLFWDEPEANLNPAIIKQVAESIIQIASSGIQVFIGTHSLFLIRELNIRQLRSAKNLDIRYFGLRLSEDAVVAEQSSSVDKIGSIRALDEELQQSNRYIDADMEERNLLVGESRPK